MAYTVDREKLQYNYSWKREDGDGKYIGPLDRNKVDKTEGYEVVEFIENLMDDHELDSVSDQKRVESALKHKSLSDVQNRAELIAAVEEALGL